MAEGAKNHAPPAALAYRGTMIGPVNRLGVRLPQRHSAC